MSTRELTDGSMLEVPDDSILEEWVTHSELSLFLGIPENSPQFARCPRVLIGSRFRLYNKRTVALWLKSMEKTQGAKPSNPVSADGPGRGRWGSRGTV